MSNSALMNKPPPSNGSAKFITFALGREHYGLEIIRVREIIAAMEITAVPRMPAYVKGVINLRGQVISVIDLRAKFGMPAAERTNRTCIIIVEVKREGRTVHGGIIVDRVLEVLELPASQIEPPPSLGPSVADDVLLGIGKAAGRVTLLLDIGRVIATQDVVVVPSLQRAASSAAADRGSGETATERNRS